MNTRETFQRAMDIEFIRENDKFVVNYLDDITMYSQSDKEHCDHLRKVFLKCKKFGLSLNLKKIIVCHERRKIIGAYRVS